MLLDAGAVLIGKANMHEIGGCQWVLVGGHWWQ